MTHLLFLTLMEVDRTSSLWQHEGEAMFVLQYCVVESDALCMTTADATVDGTLPPAI